MKKIILILISIFLFIPVVVNAASCDPSKVYIDSIEIDNSKGIVEEIEQGTAKDKKINLNLRMTDKDDEILYKLVLKNDSEDDYEISKNNISLSSDYIDYSLESDDNNIVKRKSSKTIYLRVKYSNKVDQSKFVNGVYQDDITMKVNLRSDDISNPNTGISYIVLISLILIICEITLIIFKKKKKLSTLIILIGIILLPIGVNALCTCEIVIESKVIIKTEEEAHVKVNICEDQHDYLIRYRVGMSFNDFINSNYIDMANPELISYIYQYEFDVSYATNEYFDCIERVSIPVSDDYQDENEYNEALYASQNELNICKTNYLRDADVNEQLHNKDEGTYIFKLASPCYH